MRRMSKWISIALAWTLVAGPVIFAQSNRFATSDNHSGYVHWIELYDAKNNKITPESQRPYSPAATCGRCHDVETISHGFHFQAGMADIEGGRVGQPLVWSDPKTGTQLPLSYRGWDGTHDPDKLGITRWQMALQFGGFWPGGGPGRDEHLSQGPQPEPGTALAEVAKNRSAITGPLLIDCMLCHHRQGSGYSPFAWTEQIKQENFAFAPMAAMGLGNVEGAIKRLKDDFDPAAEGSAAQLPQVKYEASRFRSDGKVLFNLTRKPENNACYYCHTQTTAAAVQGQRWLHDEDVHLRAGMSCVDCHRNGLDHATVRGYPGEKHPSSAAATLSCQGCHLGQDVGEGAAAQEPSLLTRAGKLGAPRPAHRGIPPLHFERMTCTACHSGPLPDASETQLLSAIHHLGEHVKRHGAESPPVGASVQLKTTWAPDGAAKYAPHRWLWPSFWGVEKADGTIKPLHPDLAAKWLRGPLKVRQEFDEIAEVKLTAAQRKEVLGEERGKVPEAQHTEAEKQKLLDFTETLRIKQIDQRLRDGLAAIQAENKSDKAVFVSGGQVYRVGDEGQLTIAPAEGLQSSAAAYLWPVAHNVRPATQSLGAKSCTECHSDEAKFFPQPLVGMGVVPGQTTASIALPPAMDGDKVRQQAWNQLMQGRGAFKIFAVMAIVAVTLLWSGAVITWGMERRTPTSPKRSWLMRWLYMVFLLSLLVLAGTSFGSLAQGHEMHAWPLLIHVSVAGAFLGLLVIVAYGYLPGSRDVAESTFTRWTAVAMVGSCLATVVMIVPGMFPWLGTPEMLQSIDWHRNAGMVAVVTASLHGLSLGLRKTPRKEV
ncbi:MAG: hypothetical protein JNL67_03440 [Planctomycetaceae bacterium]|nr:hypothetical protein [Planctomycetaceae bacterium]